MIHSDHVMGGCACAGNELLLWGSLTLHKVNQTLFIFEQQASVGKSSELVLFGCPRLYLFRNGRIYLFVSYCYVQRLVIVSGQLKLLRLNSF